MGMVIQHNMSSLNANRNLGVVSGQLSKSTEKLSSGYKINRAGDNAAGLAISEKMRGQIRGLNQASSNSEDGISMIQTAEGALTETHSILQRMRELAVQASNDTNTDDDRTQIQNEIDQLTSEVDRIAGTTEFNSKKLLDGSRTGSISEKAGKANVDGTFANSNVSASITTNGSSKEAYTDVIRVEVTSDFEAGMSTKGTPKYTNGELTDTATAATSAYRLIQTELTADNTLSVDEGLAAALKTAVGTAGAGGTGLKGAQTTLDTTNEAITTNKAALDTLVKNIMKDNDITKSAAGNTSNAGILADGVTEDALKTAMQKLADAYLDSGIKAAVNTGANESANVTAAKAELAALFNTGTTATTTAAITATQADLATGFVTKDNATGAAAASVTTATAIGTMAGSYRDNLYKVAARISDVTIDQTADQKAVNDAQKKVDLLSNKELAKAAYEYGDASVKKTAATATADKNTYQAIMDKASDKIKDLNAGKKVIDVKDLFGNSADSKKFEIASQVADDGSLTITMKNGENADDTIITIQNADKMKAGDVVTLTSEKYTETKQAAVGEEALRLQVGANAGQEVALGINSMKANDLNIVQTKAGSEGKALDVTSQATASLAVNAYDMAIQKVSTERAKMGAVQNRLEHTISNLDTSAENLQSAESRIRDVDMAEEMTQYSKSNILMQAGQSMLAQANQSTQGVLSLLQ